MAADRAVALLLVGILLAAILMAHLSAADEGVPKDEFGTRLRPRVRVSVRRLSPEEVDARLQPKQPSNNKQPIAREQLVDDSPRTISGKQLDRSEFIKRQLRINQEMRLRQSRDKKPGEGHNHEHHDHGEQDGQLAHEHHDHGEQSVQLAPEQQGVVQLTPEQQDEQQQLRSELTIGDFVSATGAQSYYDLPEEPVPFNVPEEPSFNAPEEPSARAEDDAAISEDFHRQDPASEGQQEPDYKYGPPAPQEPPKDRGHGYADASHQNQQPASHDDQATTMMPMDASYTFGYNFPEVSRNEAADASGNVQGNFTYLDENGKPLTVSYIAGKGTGVVILRDDRVPAADGQQQPAPVGSQQGPVKQTQVYNQPSHSYGPPAQQQQPSSGQNVQIQVKQPVPSHSYGPPAQQPAAHGYGDASQQNHHAVPTQHGDSATTMMPMDASYSFGYNLPEGSRNEVADPSGNVEGNFTYLDETGRPLTVQYKAGKGTGVVILRDDRVPAANGPATGASQQPGTYAKPQQPAKPQQVYAPPQQKKPSAVPVKQQTQQGYPAAQQQRPAPIPRPQPQQKPAPIPRPQPQQQKPAPIPRPQPQQRPIQPVKAVVVPIRPAISSPLPPKNLPKPKPWPQQQQPPKPQQQYGPPRPAPQPAKPHQQYQPAAAKPQQQYQPASAQPQQQYGPPKPQQQYGPPRPATQPPKPQQQYQPAPPKPQQQYGPPKPQRPPTQPAVKPAVQHYPKPAASSPPQNQHYQPAPMKGGNMMMMPMPYKFSYTGPHGVYRMEQADASGNFVSRYGYNLGPGHTNLMWEQSMGNQNAFPAFSRNDANEFGGQNGFPQRQQDFTSSGQGQQNFGQSFQPIDLRKDTEGQDIFSAPSGQGQAISQQDPSSGDSDDQRTFFPVHPSWSQSPGNAPVLNQLPTEDQPLPTLPSHHERAQTFPWSNVQQHQPADQSASQGDTYNQFTRHDQQATPTGQPSAYSFSYDAGDHRRSESLDPNRVVTGSYSFVGDDGVERTVQYSAGPGTGFVAQGDHLPQPPAVPQQQQQQQQVHQHSRRSVRHTAPVVAPWSGTYFIPGGYSYSIRY